jgi:hypothetical protein
MMHVGITMPLHETGRLYIVPALEAAAQAREFNGGVSSHE